MMKIHESVYIADGAKVVGEKISIGAESSIWFNSVVRQSGDQSIEVGERTNIQDLSVVHTGTHNPVKIGDDVTIGHMCLIHGCTIGNNTLVGMNSTIMNGAEIGENCIIGAGSLITEGKQIPAGSMAFGRPAKVVRTLTDEEIAKLKLSAKMYVDESREMM